MTDNRIFEIYGKHIAIPCFITKIKWLAFQKMENLNVLTKYPGQYVLCMTDKWGFWKYNFEDGCFESIRRKPLIKT